VDARAAADLRRWIGARRAGARWEQAERRDRVPAPADAVAAGLDLIDFAAEVTGWPIPDDARQRADAEATRRIWRRLRERLSSR
jgi:hypothetical protein